MKNLRNLTVALVALFAFSSLALAEEMKATDTASAVEQTPVEKTTHEKNRKGKKQHSNKKKTMMEKEGATTAPMTEEQPAK